ncbi:MAG: dihydroorotate dehydrogenase [Synergistaceae bacterium]|nr:dihydroorotate dehydrogenase [Synergistaceae bacterium]
MMAFPDLSVSIGDLRLDSPVIIASGLWPFDAPFWEEEALAGIGAIASKGLTFRPKEGNGGIRLWETPSGLLNSIGLQNPGLETFVEKIAPTLSRHRPLIVNVAVENLSDLEASLDLLRSMQQRPEVVELNVSCPNVDGGGMAWGVSAEGIAQVLTVARKAWTDSLWVKLTPQALGLADIVAAAEEGGADALVAGNTWLGMAIDVEGRCPVFARTFAGLSGPAVFPLALRFLWEVVSLTNLPVVGCGGVESGDDLLAMVMAGASAVEVGTVLVRDFQSPRRLCREVEEYLIGHDLTSLRSLQGMARRERRKHEGIV